MGTLITHPHARASRAQVLRLADFRPATPERATPVVRITHFAERSGRAGQSPHLRISGRLIDVCAALERLAAAEARRPTPLRRA